MAGVIGTALMLLECSGKGALIDLDAMPARRGGFPALADGPQLWFLAQRAGAGPAGGTGPLRRARLSAASIGRIDDSRHCACPCRARPRPSGTWPRKP
jgi:hypothetical protein